MLLCSYTLRPDQLSPTPSFHCTDPRQDGSSPKLQSSKRYEPNSIELNRILVDPSNPIIDDHEDIEEIGVKPLFCSQSLIHSADDSAESIATPPDSDLEDEQLRMMLASHWILKYWGTLMRSAYRSEKQMHNEHKPITQDEKA